MYWWTLGYILSAILILIVWCVMCYRADFFITTHYRFTAVTKYTVSLEFIYYTLMIYCAYLTYYTVDTLYLIERVRIKCDLLRLYTEVTIMSLT